MSDLMKIIISCSPVGAVFIKYNDLNTQVFLPHVGAHVSVCFHVL